MGLAGVLFDMDGLLVDTEPIWMTVERAVVDDLGGSRWTQQDQHAILGLALPLASEYMRRHIGTDVLAERIAELVVDGFLAEVAAGGPIVIQPGARELVGEVAAAGLPFALVSASVRPIMDVVTAALDRAGFPPFLVTVAGDEVDRGKPDPQPYLRAADLLGVPIGSCVVLEDSANGVQAGLTAGAAVVAVEAMVSHPPRERMLVRPDLVGLTLRDLRRLAG